MEWVNLQDYVFIADVWNGGKMLNHHYPYLIIKSNEIEKIDGMRAQMFKGLGLGTISDSNHYTALKIMWKYVINQKG